MNRATWWTQKTNAVTYVRCVLPGRYLPGKTVMFDHADAKLDGEHEDGSPRVAFPNQEGGAAIWQFPGNSVRALMMRAQRMNGLRTLVEVDDNYQVMPPNPPPGFRQEWTRTIVEATRDGTDLHSREAHREICSNPAVCDGVIVSTRFLEKRYRSLTPNVYRCLNCVDPVDWEPIQKRDDGILRIGWAASHSHWHDGPLLTQAMRWLQGQDGVEIVLIGLQPWPDLEATRVPWTYTLEDYRRSLQLLDVGFAPVLQNEWANARSDLKVLEYAMSGAMAVVSRTEPYHDWWERDSPCLTATTARDFLRAAQWCVAHRDEVRSIAAQARERVLAERRIEDNIWRWEEAIAAPAERQGTLTAIGGTV